MDIHARIGLQLSSGEVISIYNNREGTPEIMGGRLLQGYNNQADILSLLNKGDVDVIESSTTWENTLASPKVALHYKDRGDTNVDAKTHQSPDHFLQETLTDAGSWAYLYTDRYSDGVLRWVYFNIPENVPDGHQITDYVQWSFVN